MTIALETLCKVVERLGADGLQFDRFLVGSAFAQIAGLPKEAIYTREEFNLHLRRSRAAKLGWKRRKAKTK